MYLFDLCIKFLLFFLYFDVRHRDGYIYTIVVFSIIFVSFINEATHPYTHLKPLY